MQPSYSPTSGRIPLAVVVGLAVVVAASLALGLVNAARAGAAVAVPAAGQQTGISICGHGKAAVKPDQARIQAGVRATAPTAEAARAQAASAMSAILAALKSGGVADADIQTSYFAVEPNFTYDATGSHQNGFVATNNVSVTIRAIDKAGAIVDAMTRAGSDSVSISGIQFSSGDPTRAQSDAQHSALADAKRQAQEIADGAGVALGAPISIQVGGCGAQSQPPVVFGTADASQGKAAPPPTPIQPGPQEVIVDVAVVYAIR
jgi:uncharacterized protein YggE